MIRGQKTPFPKKIKPTTTVFTTPQKRDAWPDMPSGTKAAAAEAKSGQPRKNYGGGSTSKAVAEAKPKTRKGYGGGKSAKAVAAYAR